MSFFFCISIASLIVAVQAITPTIAPVTKVLTGRSPAIVPTEPGQIGVNPVSVNVGPESQYVAPIGTDSGYLVIEGSTTKWVGVNTEYLTVIPGTASGTSTTAASTVQLAVETASATADGLSPGDITVVLPQAFSDALKASVDKAVQACNVAAKLRKRTADDVMSCLLNAASDASESGGIMDLINASEWDRLVLTLSEHAPQVLKNAWQVAKTQAAKNKLAIFVVAAAIITGDVAKQLSPKLKFSGGKVGPTATVESSSTTSTSTCNPSATPDENTPGCYQDDCKGNSENLCTVGSEAGCPCLIEAMDIHQSYFDKSYWDEQQALLASAAASPVSTQPVPSCIVNTDGKNFAGEPRASPESWCICTCAGTTGLYSTQTSTSTSPCAWSTLPTATIIVSTKPPAGGSVTSCRVVTDTVTTSGTQYFTSCTCNDDNSYATTSVSVNGKATVGCPATSTMPPSSAAPAPPAAPAPTGPDGRSTLSRSKCQKDSDPNAVAFHRPDAVGTIAALCKNPLLGKKHGCIQTLNQPEYLGDGNGLIFAKANVTNDRNGPCSALPFDVNTDKYTYADKFEAMCNWALLSAMDNCDQASTPIKYGGSNVLNCIEYTIYGYNRKDGLPKIQCP